MNLDGIPVWVKALAAAFIGGFAGAVYNVLVQQQGQPTTDYKKAVSAGLLAGVIAVVAYLKPAPGQIAKLILIGCLATSLSAASCASNSRSLAKLGYDVNAGINQGVKTTINLKDQGVIFQNDDIGFRDFLRLLARIQTDTDQLNKKLDQLGSLDTSNKTEILNFIDQVAGEFATARAIGTVKLPPQAVNSILVGQALLNGARIVVASFKGAPKTLSKITYKPVLP